MSLPISSSAEEFMNHLLDSMNKKHIHLDKSRKDFTRSMAISLDELVDGQLEGMTHYRRLLLGRKGVGKTTFLRAILDASNTFFSSRCLFCVYVEYGLDAYADRLPIQEVFHYLKQKGIAELPEIVWESISDLEEWLVHNNYFLFLILDGFDFVYTNYCPTQGRKIIQEAWAIGSSREGRIQCVLSGNSAVLRQLCFSKASKKLIEEGGYCNYIAGYDLNSTKYVTCFIYPFLDHDDFLSIVKGKVESLTDEQLAQLYLHTSGYGRVISTYLDESCTSQFSSPFLLTLDELSDRQKQILHSIYRTVSFMMKTSNSQSKLENVTKQTQLISNFSVIQSFRDMEEIERLIDAGFVRVEEQLIGFGSPFVFNMLK